MTWQVEHHARTSPVCGVGWVREGKRLPVKLWGESPTPHIWNNPIYQDQKIGYRETRTSVVHQYVLAPLKTYAVHS